MEDWTTRIGVFALAGPKARDVLAEVIRDAEPETALSNKRFPWLSAKKIELGMCPLTAVRVAYTGELGWELHHPIEMQNYLWDLLMTAGETHGLKLVGARAQNWLRQEKSYRAFGTELGRDATPLEAGLDRFVDLSKDFHGKAAMVATGIRSKCVTLLIDGPEDADPWGREALVLRRREGRPAHLGRLLGGRSASRSAWATCAPTSPRPAPGSRCGCRTRCGTRRWSRTARTTRRMPVSAPMADGARAHRRGRVSSPDPVRCPIPRRAGWRGAWRAHRCRADLAGQGAGGMTDETITGSCHCGAVRFEISRPARVTSCNCSACRRYAALWAYVPPAIGRLIAAPGATLAYAHGDKTLAFHSCATCGVTTHWASLIDEKFAVNMRLVDDPKVLDTLPVHHFDGAESWTFLD